MKSFSLWCDFIEREFLENEFEKYIKSGHFNGATSNPAIFANALKSKAYSNDISRLKASKMQAKEIYENLACADIKKAAHLLKDEYKNGNGYISIEIDPFLSQNIGASIDEGRRLYKMINMPNVMIKVPANKEGYEIMSELSKEDISINATLVFSKEQALECIQAFQAGRKGKEDKPWHGVISVFVSRFDRAIDASLDSHLKGKLGVANALLCYEAIEAAKIESIRTLFASTGVKAGSVDAHNKPLSNDYYIKSLKLPHSINTAPLETINAYLSSLDNSSIGLIQPSDALFDNARQVIKDIASKGIDLDTLSLKLMDEGMEAFKKSFEEMLKTL